MSNPFFHAGCPAFGGAVARLARGAGGAGLAGGGRMNMGAYV
jgi:hypothetical protein